MTRRVRLALASGWLMVALAACETSVAESDGVIDPHFPTCQDAIAAGYGPYRADTDPEYAWYIDRDADGVVCEH